MSLDGYPTSPLQKTCLCLSQSTTWISNAMFRGHFCFQCDCSFCFMDIGGIADHHCLEVIVCLLILVVLQIITV
jgi:hypothetical protein